MQGPSSRLQKVGTWIIVVPCDKRTIIWGLDLHPKKGGPNKLLRSGGIGLGVSEPQQCPKYWPKTLEESSQGTESEVE